MVDPVVESAEARLGYVVHIDEMTCQSQDVGHMIDGVEGYSSSSDKW
ncbi:MAG: hypothetical protein OXT74_04290 [Candidatus Poribacteria bacterium]|nr:hypothetical protein [Candidatus Poribacteria bacterium]